MQASNQLRIFFTILLCLAGATVRAAAPSPYVHEESRDLVAFVHAAADQVNKEGEAAFAEFRKEGGAWFQGERYVFVWDLRGQRYVYPPDPTREGQNVMDLVDIGGKPIGRMFVATASGPAGEGWVHYQWWRPNDPVPTWKSTYVVKAVAPSGKAYLVASGGYEMQMESAFIVQAVDDAVALLERQGRAAFDTLRDPRGPFYFYDTYVFVTSENGVELVNPAFPALEGHSLIDARDTQGKYLVRDYLAAARQHGSAWVSYFWPRPGSREAVRKQTYVKGARVDAEWLVVGAGMYDPVPAAAAHKKERSEMTGKAGALKVAILHLGPISDHGWTFEGHQGATRMVETLPAVHLDERELAVGPWAPKIMSDYAEAGYRVIFCHSFDCGPYLGETAARHPGVVFMWAGGLDRKASNIGTYFARMYQARYLAGMVAGSMTKTDKIGYAAAMPIPEVVRGINAFARGVAAVNGKARVLVDWVGTWYDPPRERTATLSLLNRGCDVLTHHTDSSAPAEAAQEKGAYYLGFGSDTRQYAPRAFLTSTVWNWAPLMTDIVRAVQAGAWDEHPGHDWWYGLAEGAVDLAPFGDAVPAEVRATVAAARQGILEGRLVVFPDMNDQQLREMSDFEANVVGGLPQAAK
jgi:basic membrane lipoprotein Med (substrate-binding protein (PBP1-ABC) superfamily)